MMVVVMGVSGVGKTTIGQALATALGCEFIDADDLHSPSARAKMARGEPLSDEDRAPWLERVASEMRLRLARGAGAVVACSALKASYRRVLLFDARIRLVYLTAPPSVLAARLRARQGHYMPASLLPSQLATLEPPADAIVADATRPVAVVVAQLQTSLSA